MPIQWSEGILLAELSDEPEMSEELSAIFDMLKSLLPGQSIPNIVLNFGGVSYLNSSHLTALLRLRKKLTEADRILVLCDLSDALWSVMLMTGLDKVFVWAPDTMTALARVQLESDAEDNG